MIGYVTLITLSSLTTTVLAMFCSVIFRKTSVAMMTTYLVLMLLYAVPLAAKFFAVTVLGQQAVVATIDQYTFTSPFAAAYALPLTLGETTLRANWPVFFGYLAFTVMVNLTLLWAMLWLFNVRWRVRTQV
jgi:hypothetical protein